MNKGHYLGKMVSHRDFGDPAGGQQDVPRPRRPDGTSYPFASIPFAPAQAAGTGDAIWQADGRRSPGTGGQLGRSRPPGDGLDRDEPTAPYPLTYDRDDFYSPFRQPDALPRESYHPWPPAPYPAFLRQAAQDTGKWTDSGGGRASRARRWLILAGIVAGAATVGAAAVLLNGGHPSAGANGQEFALLTTNGGALVFYTDAAKLTITPPAGKRLRLTIPGLYSSGQALSRAGVSYLEQFAAYDPPAGAGGTPRIVADYSAVTGKN